MASKNKKKQVEEMTNGMSNGVNALFTVASAVAVYVIGLWAIDSGSLIVYALAFGSFYALVYYLKLFIRGTFFNNDKPAKAQSAKK